MAIHFYVKALLLMIFHSTCGQEVKSPIKLESQTGQQTVGSTSVITIEILLETNGLFWTINKTDVFQCNTFKDSSCGCSIIDGPYKDRLNQSCTVSGKNGVATSALFRLELGPVQMDDSNLPIYMRGAFGSLGNVTFTSLADCAETPAEGVDTSSAPLCGYGCKQIFSCLPNYSGLASGTCEADGSVTYDNNCTGPITCSIPPAIDCDCKYGFCNLTTFNSNIMFGDVVEFPCQDGCYPETTGRAECTAQGLIVVKNCSLTEKCSRTDLMINDVTCSVLGDGSIAFNEIVILSCVGLSSNCTGTGTAHCVSGGLTLINYNCVGIPVNGATTFSTGEMVGASVGSSIGGIAIGIGALCLLIYFNLLCCCCCCGFIISRKKAKELRTQTKSLEM